MGCCGSLSKLDGSCFYEFVVRGSLVAGYLNPRHMPLCAHSSSVASCVPISRGILCGMPCHPSRKVMGEECKWGEQMQVWGMVKTKGRRKVEAKWEGKKGGCFGKSPLGFFYRSL